MKKRKIQKLLAVFLAASTSVTAMPAGGTAAGCAGLKSVFAAEKNENTKIGYDPAKEHDSHEGRF